MRLDRPPHIRSARLLDDEAAEAAHLNLLLESLGHCTHTFQDALSLLDHCRAILDSASAKSDWDSYFGCVGWPLVAARDAAMTIYHFGILVSAIQTRIGLCPTLMPYFDRAMMKTARRRFNQHFSRSTRLRHAISHAAETLENPQQFKRHYGRLAPLSFLFLSDSLLDRSYTTMLDGETLSIDITTTTLQRLKEIEQSVFAAFMPVEIAFGETPTPSSQS